MPVAEVLAKVPVVARGVFRVRSQRVNCYLVRDGAAFTLVDSGLPAHWPAIKAACGTRRQRRAGPD